MMADVALIAEIRKRVNGDPPLHFRKWARDRVNAILDEVEAEAQSDEARWAQVESDLERIEDTVRVIAALRGAREPTGWDGVIRCRSHPNDWHRTAEEADECIESMARLHPSDVAPSTVGVTDG